MDEKQPIKVQTQGDNVGLKPGEIFWNNYRIIGITGRGGVSTVYKAENINTKEIVAIKFLHAKRVRDEELVRRFVREAKTTTKLSHQNAIQVFDWGFDGQERPFMIMEFLQGETLSKRIQRSGGFNYKKAVEIFDQICDAVGEAHELGIIHRDLKPDNIMLVNHNGLDDWVKVFDFGIAKMMTPEDGDAYITLTRTGAILGTPVYMSPEQLRGRKADVRSDIYALGIILYEMLTGKPPFQSKNTAEIVIGHLNVKPELPHIVRMDLNIPESLSAEVLKALSKNAWERPGSVSEFRANVDKAIQVADKPFPMNPLQASQAAVTSSAATSMSSTAFSAAGAVMHAHRKNKGEPTEKSQGRKKGKQPGFSLSYLFRMEVITVLVFLTVGVLGYCTLAQPVNLAGHYAVRLSSPIFGSEDSKANEILRKEFSFSECDLIVKQSRKLLEGEILLPKGKGQLKGDLTDINPILVSCHLQGTLPTKNGNLDFQLNGEIDKLSRTQTWIVEATINRTNQKPVSDVAVAQLTKLVDEEE